eukprot:2122984-Pyramimonas_sp.AAC.1
MMGAKKKKTQEGPGRTEAVDQGYAYKDGGRDLHACESTGHIQGDGSENHNREAQQAVAIVRLFGAARSHQQSRSCAHVPPGKDPQHPLGRWVLQGAGGVGGRGETGAHDGACRAGDGDRPEGDAPTPRDHGRAQREVAGENEAGPRPLPRPAASS